jgi:hypothetical protein
MERIGKYLTVHGGEPLAGRRTLRWEVQGNDSALLGTVRWYGAWRQYTFDPTPGTTFNRDCLIDLANFLRRVNDEHKIAQRAEKDAPDA